MEGKNKYNDFDDPIFIPSGMQNAIAAVEKWREFQKAEDKKEDCGAMGLIEWMDQATQTQQYRGTPKTVDEVIQRYSEGKMTMNEARTAMLQIRENNPDDY